MTRTAAARSNWGQTAHWTPTRHLAPRTEEELSHLVQQAASRGEHLRAIGSGHSFSPVAATQGWQLDLRHLQGLVSVDHARHRAVLLAGTPLSTVTRLLAAEGLALANMGDIDRQTLAGAVSTGTHGTGLRLTGFAGTVLSLSLMLADGRSVRVSAQEDPDLFHAARVGMGAFGVVTEIEIQCVPAYLLRSQEWLEPVEDVVETFLERSAAQEHLEFFWFPYTRRAVVKSLESLPVETPRVRRPALERLVSEELLGNTAFAALCRAGLRIPAVQPAVNRVSAWALPGPSQTDDWHRVYVSQRRVRFREMEYALPLEHFAEAFVGLRRILTDLDRSGHRVGFPVEVRTAAADDVWLSTAYGSPRVYIAVHEFYLHDHRPLFEPVEALFAELGGRPHWGKMHTRTAEDLGAVYPRLPDVQRVLQRVDPQGVFSSPWTRRVLGDPGILVGG